MTVERYRDKFRIPSARLQNRSYAVPGKYFVTICTRGKRCFFGSVEEGELRLSRAGLIVKEEWEKTQRVRAGVQLDEWIVMPNHLHGIIAITGVVTARRAAPG